MNKEEKLHARLKKVEGQIRALAERLEDADCVSTITQFKAAKAALEGAYAEYLEDHLQTCAQKKDSKTLKEIINHITKQ